MIHFLLLNPFKYLYIFFKWKNRLLIFNWATTMNDPTTVKINDLLVLAASWVSRSWFFFCNSLIFCSPFTLVWKEWDDDNNFIIPDILFQGYRFWYEIISPPPPSRKHLFSLLLVLFFFFPGVQCTRIRCTVYTHPAYSVHASPRKLRRGDGGRVPTWGKS